jgi:hypothetical protein
MKTRIWILLTTVLFMSCSKEDVRNDYITYDSEIFSGTDTLIYGQWKYLYSSGGFGGGTKEDFGGFLLSIVPIGNYAMISKDNISTTGKILIEEKQGDNTSIRFCKDGIKNNTQYISLSQTIYFGGPDTLILVDPCCDLYSHYYKRIK